MTDTLHEYIARRKQELNALILAHYYQLPEIQDVADFVGDSLQLARQAAATDASIIVFCGVSFMAESAKILSPDKVVLLPEKKAGCEMAKMISGQDLRALKEKYPGAVVVCYVNSTAEVKAESDICCTSANAINVVRSIPEDKTIIFVPDRNLGAYIQSQTGRKMILWEGCCPVHDQLRGKEVQELVKLHPGAKVVVHPECAPDVIGLADAVRSTAGILNYVKSSMDREFIIGTEEGFLYTLQKNCPDKIFYLARQEFRCHDMKLTSLEKLAESLKYLENKIEVDENIRQKAYQTLDRMISIS
ncbi:MAG: quinolinate synthase NadA [Syntrophomonadaceae bacterium]|jgi:quinolinate synthase